MPRTKVSLEELRADLFNQIDHLKEKLQSYESHRLAVLTEKQSSSPQSVILEKTKEAADLISLYSQTTFRTADQAAEALRKNEKRRQEKIAEQQANTAELKAMRTAGELAIKGLEMSLAAYLSEGVLVANVNLVGEKALGPHYFEIHSLKRNEWQREVERVKTKLAEVFPHSLYPKLHQRLSNVVDKIKVPTTLAPPSPSRTRYWLSLAIVREELFGELRELKMFQNTSLSIKPGNTFVNQTELARAHEARIKAVEDNIRSYLSEGKLFYSTGSSFTEMASMEMAALTDEQWQDECEIIRDAIRANSFPPSLRRTLARAIPDYRPENGRSPSATPVPSHRPRTWARASVTIVPPSGTSVPPSSGLAIKQRPVAERRRSTAARSIDHDRAAEPVLELATTPTTATTADEPAPINDLKQMFQSRVIELLNQPAKPGYFADFFQARIAVKHSFLNGLNEVLASKAGVELHTEIRNFIAKAKTERNYSQVVAGCISHRVRDLISDIEASLAPEATTLSLSPASAHA